MMGTHKKLFITALASLLMAGHAFAQAPVFITAGQSNADGPAQGLAGARMMPTVLLSSIPASA